MNSLFRSSRIYYDKDYDKCVKSNRFLTMILDGWNFDVIRTLHHETSVVQTYDFDCTHNKDHYTVDF